LTREKSCSPAQRGENGENGARGERGGGRTVEGEERQVLFRRSKIKGNGKRKENRHAMALTREAQEGGGGERGGAVVHFEGEKKAVLKKILRRHTPGLEAKKKGAMKGGTLQARLRRGRKKKKEKASTRLKRKGGDSPCRGENP